jgi:hypothetical protein
MASFRVPSLSNSNTIIRLAEDPAEIAATNRLVYKNYVAARYWEANTKHLQNKLVDSASRKVVVAKEDDRLVGTISLIVDSPLGLPSDGAQPALMRQLRAKGGILAEVSGFAIDARKTTNRRLALFLASYVLQYAYFYEGVDQLAASCIATHANFYQSAAGFSMISGPTSYGSPMAPDFYLLSLDLNEIHAKLSSKRGGTVLRGETFCRFMLRDPQPCHRFPSERQLKRPRGTDTQNYRQHVA